MSEPARTREATSVMVLLKGDEEREYTDVMVRADHGAQVLSIHFRDLPEGAVADYLTFPYGALEGWRTLRQEVEVQW